MADVVARVEVRVVDPHGPALHERREGQLLAVARHEREAALELRDEVLVGRCRALEEQDRSDVHVRASLLEREERGVEAAQPVGVRHAPIVAHAGCGRLGYTKGFRTFHNVYNVRMAAAIRDPETFRRIYDEHGRGVYAAALRILGDPAQAQDVTQDVFLKLWRKPEKFDARRGQLGPYLRLMARSRALDLWREGQAAGRASDRLKVVVGHAEPRVDEAPAFATERDESRDAVRSALRRLPTAQREALVLAYWGGMTADEIARRSHVPLGTAKSRIRLGPRPAARGVRRRLVARCVTPPSGASLSSNARSAAEPSRKGRGGRGNQSPAPGGEPAGANRRLLPP